MYLVTAVKTSNVTFVIYNFSWKQKHVLRPYYIALKNYWCYVLVVSVSLKLDGISPDFELKNDKETSTNLSYILILYDFMWAGIAQSV
jgi:hypothetical protein